MRKKGNFWKNWGLRIDDIESAYVARKFGWFESGWSGEFLEKCFRKNGMRLKQFTGGHAQSSIGIAKENWECDSTENYLEKLNMKLVSNKFGLSQLHQLRGRVGRGKNQGKCILLFKDSLSKSSVQRIKILKKSNDGFFIAEEDLKLRGYGDLIGYQQSGLKNFKFADPFLHKDLFELAEKYILEIENNLDYEKYIFLLKLFDRAEIINIDNY